VVLQKVNHQSQDVQDLSADLATLPQHLSSSSLSHFLVQLQTIVTSENSSAARETLQEQLRQLIAALSSWNNQLLAAGSPTVKRMMQGQGKSQATKYVNQVAQLSCQDMKKHIRSKLVHKRQLEIGD
jgi:hypothetical protein